MKNAELLLDCRCEHGEGPIYDASLDRLYWVDMMGCKLHALELQDDSHKVRSYDEMVCALSPLPNNEILIAFAKRLARLNLEDESLTTLVAVEPEQPNNRCNDGKMDPSGRFWIGTMAASGGAEGAGSLYRWDESDGILRTILTDITCSNGLGWSQDQHSQYYIDTMTREVWAFDFNPEDSSISNRRTAVTIPPELGLPDGMCMAPDDTLWVAHWGGSCVCHWDPTNGTLIEKVHTGCPLTTSCAFGKNGRLYITTSRQGLSAEELKAAPHSGSLFRVDV